MANPQGGDGSSFSKPIALLDAESRISRQLAKNPDDAQWLRLRAHAEMLDQHYDDAISTLNRAIDAQPDNTSLLADLGMAYALRAEAQNRDVDYGYAIEYIGRSLKAKPNALEVVFNQTVVYERMYLYEDAVSGWRRYLEVDAAGAWREEAQRYLAGLEQKKKVRQAELALISNNPELLLRRIAEGEEVEPESYLDVAVVEWLPRRWKSAKYDRAMSALAARFEAQHEDRWLRDVLSSQRSEELDAGLATLSEAVRANLSDESDRALAKSTEAVDQLRAAGSQAGVIRADLERTYALFRGVRSAAECLQRASMVERRAEGKNYTWILGQAILDEGTCRGRLGDSGAAHRDMERALDLVHHFAYPELELRAASILAGEQTESGNLLASWKRGREELAKYWSGPYSGVRALQIYFNLVRSAESLRLSQAAYAFQRATVMAIAETPRRRLAADARGQLARLAVEAGRPEEANVEFDRAASLLDQLHEATDLQYRTLAELYRAQAEIAAGAPDAALQHLEAIRPSAVTVDAALIHIRFQQVLGDSLWRCDRPDEAEVAYRQAIDLSERRLTTLPGSRERAQLMLVAGKAYRGLVELLFDRRDLAEALRVWEWFRAAEGPGPRGKPDLDQRRMPLRNESFLTYAFLPSGVVAWLFDDRGIEGQRLHVTPGEMEIAVSRFLRECADPGSDQRAVQRDARQLYDWLVAPLGNRLDTTRTLVIEPDGVIGAIPMQALMDGGFRYLGERFAIVAASSLADYQQRAAGPVNTGLKALVVASPKLGEEMSKTFPPLPGTMREAKSVAERFHGSVLLVGEQATLQSVEQNRPNAELFHFAGHGFSNANNGGLLLSPDEINSDRVGVLDGTRLAQQDWSRCRLAVLSACSTGTGEAKGPVNPESLVRGLLWAGVARVVASRWNLDTETGEPFMDQFYAELLSGIEVPTALQHAGRRLRENKATSHPYFWAGFQNFGTR
jgi:CHAT domain-containing protein